MRLYVNINIGPKALRTLGDIQKRLGLSGR